MIRRIQIRHHLIIKDVRFGLGVKSNTALDAAQPPEILAFEIGTVAPFEDLQSDEVAFPKLHEAGDVKLGVGLGVLAVAHELAVHPEVETGLCSADVDDHLLVLPRFVDVHPLAVAAHGVALHGDFRQLAVVEVVGGVHIDGHTVAVQLPVAGHGNGAPAAVVVVGAEEIGRPLVSIGDVVKRPWAVRRDAMHCVSTVLRDIGPRVELVHFEYGGVLPLGEGLRGEAEGGAKYDKG